MPLRRLSNTSDLESGGWCGLVGSGEGQGGAGGAKWSGVGLGEVGLGGVVGDVPHRG